MMAEFFYGWRRKTGAVILVIVSMLVNFWLRSEFITDRLFLRKHASTFHLLSSNGTLQWMRSTNFSYAPGVQTSGWTSSPARLEQDRDALDGLEIQWRCRFGGFDFGTGSLGSNPLVSIFIWAIPYWFAITPLALIASGLLLSKKGCRPRYSNDCSKREFGARSFGQTP